MILSEEEGERKLHIIIGGFEAQSIAIALERDGLFFEPIKNYFL